MLWSVLLSLFLQFGNPQAGEDAFERMNAAAKLIKGRHLASFVQKGMTGKEVKAIMGEPDWAGRDPTVFRPQVGSKGICSYYSYGVKVHMYTPSEIWWALSPSGGCYIPETARVTSVEFLVPNRRAEHDTD